MKAAFPYWGDRIAPVFDTARRMVLVTAESGRVISRTQAALTGDLPIQKALRLIDLDVGTLVCGAISRQILGVMAAYGIQVIPFVAGELDKGVEAWLCGQLERDEFSMPGCPPPGGRRFRGMHGGYQEAGMRNISRGRGRGAGLDAGRGAVQGRQRPGRMSGALAGGPAGACVCPRCGFTRPHERGMPCVERQCPQCGGMMTRQ